MMKIMGSNIIVRKDIFSQFIKFFGKKGQDGNETKSTLLSEIIPPERPTEVLLKIGMVYREKNRQVRPVAAFVLNPNYYYSYFDISGYDCIDSYLQRSGFHKISILDISNGDATFAKKLKRTFGEKVDITIVSPLPPEHNEDTIDGTIHIINGNIEYLYMLTKANMYDLIVTSHAFATLVDPLGTIQQLYQALVPGGLLLIDEFFLPGIHEQLPNLSEIMSANGYSLVMDYSFGVTESSITIVGVKSLFMKKTIPQLVIPGITYEGIQEEATIAASIHTAYAITPPLHSFTKQVPAETEAFIRLIHTIIPSLTEKEIATTLFNVFILNAPFNTVEKNAYEHALQTSLQALLTKYHIDYEKNSEVISRAIAMISFIANWFTQMKNKDAFLLEIQQQLGMENIAKS